MKLILNLLVAASASYGALTAATITLQDLPAGDSDTLSISLNPASGAVSGIGGSTVGWGFTVNWTSTAGDYLSFYSSSLGSLDESETNPGLQAGYIDFIGAQGGPLDFALPPAGSPWSQTFDAIAQTGVAAYRIANDPTIALPRADSGEITFDFQVYNGDPLSGGVQIGDSSYSYYGLSTQFSVTEVSASAIPEPAGIWLVGMSLALAPWLRRRG